MRIDKKHVIILALIIALAVVLHPHGGGTSEPTATIKTPTANNWFPTDIINNTLEEPKTIYSTPKQTETLLIAELPYSARTVTFTILDLAGGATISGTATYGNAATLIGEELYVNGTRTSFPPQKDPFIKVMDSIAKIVTLTADEKLHAIVNKSITMFQSTITANLPDTVATIILGAPAYAQITYTWPVLTADLRWLRPNVPTTTHQIHLPLIAEKNIETLYSGTDLTIYEPATVNGEIVTYYNTSETLLDVLFFDDRVLYNGELLTPDYASLTATNGPTTVTLSILTENPVYSLHGTLTCTENNHIGTCTVGNTTIAFNNTVIYFLYTTKTNGVNLTVQGWLAYVSSNPVRTTVKVEFYTSP